jgi:hypothetical protein
VLKPVVVRYQGKVLRIYFRADAAFAMPGVYEYLEAERIKYAIRIPRPLLRSSTYPPLRRSSARILRSSCLLLRLTRRRARCTGPFLYLRLFIVIALFPS